MDFTSSASFDAYVVYLYIVLGYPVKEIAEHQGISKDDVSEILRRYGFNFRNSYGAGQHFKAYPKGKSFRLKNGQTISLEITQDFIESYVKSGNFYDNAFEDYINRYFAPEPKPAHSPKPKRGKDEHPHGKAEQKSHRGITINPALKTALKILACVAGAALIVLLANCAGCISFDKISCAGYSPVIDGGESGEMFDLYFSVMDAGDFSSEISVLIDGEERGKINFSASDSLNLRVEKMSGAHSVEIEVNGEKSNLLSADMDAASKMYVVISMESGKPHISQTSE